MKIIAQNINILAPKVFDAVKRKDGSSIRTMAKKLLENGAHGLEINLGGWRASDAAMPWLVKQIRQVTNCPLFLSPIPSSLKDAVKEAGKAEIFINCVTAERPHLKSMLNAARCLDTGIVILLTRKGFCPTCLDEILLLAQEVIETAEESNFDLNRLVLDPILRPRLSITASGCIINRPDVTFFSEAVHLLGMLRPKKMKTAVGISNLTVGMKQDERKSLERSALCLFEASGLDYCIADCSNRQATLQLEETRFWPKQSDDMSSKGNLYSTPHC